MTNPQRIAEHMPMAVLKRRVKSIQDSEIRTLFYHLLVVLKEQQERIELLEEIVDKPEETI